MPEEGVDVGDDFVEEGFFAYGLGDDDVFVDGGGVAELLAEAVDCLLYTSPSPRD